MLGMWMMTEGLKLAAGGALRTILHSATSSSWRGLLAGLLITAVVQSSSAVTVATIGFVNAGLLNLTQSIWVVFGANLGTTITGWIVAGIGIKLDMTTLALPLLGAGMLVWLLAGGRPRLTGLGQAAAGFGAFFLGIGFLQQGFGGLTLEPGLLGAGQPLWIALPASLLFGAALTIVTQSSSAAIAIVLTATAAAGLPLELAAGAVIGTNVGTTSTAVFAVIGATPPARRVAGAHVIFNLLKAAVALLLFGWLLRLSEWVAAQMVGDADTALALAVFNTLFNLVSLALVWPFTPRLVAWLGQRFLSIEEEIGRPRHLDATLTGVPDLAVRSLVLEAMRMAGIAWEIAQARIGGATADWRGLAQRQEGLMRLGRELRAFIGQMNRGALPDSVAAAIPDIIRGVQHLEEVARISGDIAAAPHPPSAPEVVEDVAWLRSKTVESLRLAHIGDGRALDDGALDQAGEEIEARYQDIKNRLLRAAALGRVSVQAMETALLNVRQLRQCAEESRKAARRLGPWVLEVAPALDAEESEEAAEQA